jgi:hypothetical protein
MGLKLLSVRLREKTDRHGRRYLFGAIPEINCVAFVYEDIDASGEKSFEFVVKPYGKGTVAVETDAAGRKIISLLVGAQPAAEEVEEEPPARAAR